MKPTTYELALRSATAARRRFAVRMRDEDQRRALAVREAAAMMVHRNWKGAESSRLNSDWLAALLSPTDELRGDFRTIRARARELARNDAYAGQFLELVTTNVVGPDGARLRSRPLGRAVTGDDAVSNRIEAAWQDFWTGPVTADGTMSGVELQEISLETVAKEGETFLQRVVGRDFRHGLALKLIDPDLVDDNYTVQGARAEVEAYMGVEVDRYGRRRAFHVLDYPYGPGYQGRGRFRIPASEIIHVYRAKRANQMRGVTWMARAMTALKDAERYAQNELVASAAGAAKMGFITNEAGTTGAVQKDVVTTGDAAAAGDAGASSGARVTLEAEPGSIWELDAGQKFEGWSPDHPSTAYAPFMSAVLRKAASALGVSYEALSSDLSQVTYLSARAGLLIERMVWKKLQKWWVRSMLQPVFEWWLESAVLSGELELPGGDWRLYRGALWISRGWEWIDPVKDGQGYEKMIELNLTTEGRIAAERGDELEDILRDAAREKALFAKHGIEWRPKKVAALPAPAAQPSGGGPDDEPEEPEDDEPARPSRNGERGASRIAVS